MLALLGTSAHAEDSELRKLIKQSDALFEQRKFDEFLDVNKKAMALIESAPDQKPAEVAEALNNAAIGFQRQKDLGKAEALFKRSLEMAEQAGQADTVCAKYSRSKRRIVDRIIRAWPACWTCLRLSAEKPVAARKPKNCVSARCVFIPRVAINARYIAPAFFNTFATVLAISA